MFPSVAIENQTQNKLFKLANSISGMKNDSKKDTKVRMRDKEK